MRLRTRMKRFVASLPKCDGRITRLVDADYEFSEADRCPRCGGCHVLKIEEVVVDSRVEEPGSVAVDQVRE